MVYDHQIRMAAIGLALAVGLIASGAHGAVLVRWTHNQSNQLNGIIEDTTGSVASAANTSITGASGSYQVSGTITNLPAGGGFGSGWSYVAPYTAGNATSDDTTPPIDAQFYGANGWDTEPNPAKYITYELTMAAAIHPTVNQLEGIAFSLANAGTSGPRGVEVTYRIGTSGSFTSLGYTAVPNNTANNYGHFTFNLPTPASLSGGDVVTFRLLGYANASGNSIRLDNVTISAIPEPASIGLAGLTGLVALAVRRLRRAGG
ncbi:PEP-CTERM sorting domain-containing protein [Thermosphaera sp.]